MRPKFGMATNYSSRSRRVKSVSRGRAGEADALNESWKFHLSLHIVFAAEVVEAVAVHAEQTSRFRLHLLGLFQRLGHPAAFVRFHFFVEADTRGRQPEPPLGVAARSFDNIRRQV